MVIPTSCEVGQGFEIPKLAMVLRKVIVGMPSGRTSGRFFAEL